MARNPLALLAAVCAALTSACARDLGVPQPTPPVLTLRALAPNPATPGDLLVAEYEVSAEPLSCQAILGPLFATCTVEAPRICRCTAVVPEDISESVFAANLSARSAGGETRIYEPVGVDVKPPKIAAAKASFTQRAGSWTFSALPAAIFDSISGVAAVRLYAGAAGGAPLRTVALEPDGSIAALTMTGAPPAELWVEAEDRVGHVARARAGAVAVTAGLGGRSRFTPSPVHLAPYFFDADWDPTTAAPGAGQMGAGEAPEGTAAALAAADDLLVAVTTALPEPASAGTVAWASFTPSATPFTDGRQPSANFTATAYDPVRRRTVLFGGLYSQCASTATCTPEVAHPAETWEFDGETWTSLHVPGPPRRQAAAMAYDPSRGRVVLFGGGQMIGSGVGVRLDDTWEWDGTAWTQATPAHRPSGRVSGRLFYDAARGQLLLHGGGDGRFDCDGGGQDRCTGTWRYDGNDWTLVTTAAPSPARMPGNVVWSAAEGEALLYGGITGSNLMLSDLWRWDGAWTRHALSIPASSWAMPATYDVARRCAQLVTGSSVVELASAITTLPTPATPSVAFLSYDPLRRVTFASGGGPTMEILDQRTPHARVATQTFALDLAPGAVLSSLSVTYVGAGSGVGGNGVRVHVWNGRDRRWDLLGSHGAGAGTPASARTVSGAPPGAAADHAAGSRIWIMASAPPSDLAGAVESRVTTDYLQVQATYSLP